MARRKDHSPEELKHLILSAAENIIHNKGLRQLSARSVAAEIGYAPGTLYNFYRDMDALIADVNLTTLLQLYQFSYDRVQKASDGLDALRALAFSYIDFAHENERAWRTLFIETNRKEPKAKITVPYQKCLVDLFQLIEGTLEKSLGMSRPEAINAARILWASLHGITSLALDGRLTLIGIPNAHEMIEDLLTKYLQLAKTKRIQE